jgi:hypothetical protein
MTFDPIADNAHGEVFLGSQDGQVHQWEMRTRKLLRKSPLLSGYVRTIAILGDSGWVAYAATGMSRVVSAARTATGTWSIGACWKGAF